MLFPVVFTGLGLILLAVFLKFRVKQQRIKAVIMKSLVSMCFIASAISSLVKLIGSDNALFGAIITAGLIFGMLGDIWLDFKYIYRDDEYIFTISGFVVFAIGHILFNTALAMKYLPQVSKACVIIPVAFGIVCGVATFFGEKPMKVKYGRYKNISSVYCAIITSFVAFSITLSFFTGFRHIELIVLNAAGIFFLISDLILNGTYFGEGKDRPVDIITNHITYYIAQFAIAFSLCLL